MTYKKLQKLSTIDAQVYARIDEDGACRLSCTSEYPEFKQWISEGNTPLPPDQEG
jgi:hypothetical protein